MVGNRNGYLFRYRPKWRLFTDSSPPRKNAAVGGKTIPTGPVYTPIARHVQMTKLACRIVVIIADNGGNTRDRYSHDSHFRHIILLLYLFRVPYNVSPSYGRPDLIMFWNLLMAVLNFFPVPVTEECLSDDSRRTGKVSLFIQYFYTFLFLNMHGMMYISKLGESFRPVQRPTDAPKDK